MKSVKFFITPVYPYGDDHYYHEIIVLAEGFRDLGYKVLGNVDYWYEPERGKFLIEGDIDAEADIFIYDYRYVKSFAHVLFRKNSKAFNHNSIKVLVDRNSWISPDWMGDDNYSVFDVIFAGNLLSNVSYRANVRPSAIGITCRQMKNIDKFCDDSISSEDIIAYNFRVPHNLRKLIIENIQKQNGELGYTIKAKFSEYNPDDDQSTAVDKFYSDMTTRRHNPEYFKNINEYLLFFSVGGYFEFKPITFQPYTLFDKIRRKPYYFLNKFLTQTGRDVSDTIFVFQYDSFRMWETIYAKTAPILLDFDYWNLRLPVLPVEGKHYIGIKDLNLNTFLSSLRSLGRDEIRQIGRNGREFVIENYSPVASAKRLLKYIG